MVEKVVPTCRYGHGPLGKVDQKGEIPEWAVLAGRGSMPVVPSFLLALFVCGTCGYAEFFDLDPAATHRDSVSE